MQKTKPKTERLDASDKYQTIARVGTSSSDSSEADLSWW